MALTKIGATLGGSADVITVTQSSHGLYLGYPVKMTSSGYAHATANTAANAEAVGIVIATDRTGANTTFSLALGGRVTVDGCVPNLTTGTVLFLQVSAGLLAAAEPSVVNQVSKPMAVITIANSEMIMVQQRGEVVTTGTASIADGSIDNDAMADNAIDTDELLADAVTNAKLANMATRTVKANATSGSANPTDVVMADGDFLIANASGLVTVPIAGDVAVSNTGAAVIQTGAVDIAMLSASNHDNARFLRGDNTWQAAGGGNLALIGTVDASNDATITVTGLSSTYDTYLVIGSDLVPATDSQQMQIRLGDSSGVDSGGSDYEWWRVTSGTGNGSWSPIESTSDTDMQISGGSVGNDTDESGSFILWLPLPGDTASKHFIYGNSVTLTSATVLQSTEFLGSRKTAIACDRIQFLFSSGNVTSGRMTVWGLAHA